MAWPLPTPRVHSYPPLAVWKRCELRLERLAGVGVRGMGRGWAAVAEVLGS